MDQTIGPRYTTLLGINDKRAPTLDFYHIDEHRVPDSFPFAQWYEQSYRYAEYWRWFTGEALAITDGEDENGEPIYRYPLGINLVRNFARKHAAVLLGEETFDSPEPPIKTVAEPKQPFTGEDATDEDKHLASTFQNLVNEVWTQSGARTIQQENAVLSQFLGGSVFQIRWEPRRKDLLIPITLHAIPPDFFLPVWSPTDYWNLLEAYVVYRIPLRSAMLEYDYNPESGTGMPSVVFCERWRKDEYSIFLDGKPLKHKGVEYSHRPNPFKEVPFVYIPHLKEGSEYGSSMVPDIYGLIREFNGRLADLGDNIMNLANRHYYMRDVKQAKEKKIGKDFWVVDLGHTIPGQSSPEIKGDDLPAASDAVFSFPQTSIWQQAMREGNLSDIAFGEDEGSQRSALTLSFRMWPTTSHAAAERRNWTDGMNRIAKIIGTIIVTKASFLKNRGLKQLLPKDFLYRVSIGVDWKPMVPRDREQMVSEIILRLQSGSISPEKALKLFGDSRNIKDELDLIKAWLEFQASVGAKAAEGAKPKEAADGAPTQIDNEPVAHAIEGDG